MDKARYRGRARGRGLRLAYWTMLSTAWLGTSLLGEEKPLQKADLLLLESGQSMMTVGLHIRLSPGWHLYWINPGDAGLAPEVTWKLPPGLEAGPLRFPTPEKIVHGDIVAYGFKNEVLILCDLRGSAPPASSENLSIACRLNWMACQESCVTGQESVNLSPAAQTYADIERSRVIMSRFAPRFPRTPDKTQLAVKEARLAKMGKGWRVEILLSGKDAGRVSDIYPYPVENFVIVHSRIAVSGEKVSIPLEPSGPSAALVRINGLIIIGDDSYEVSIPIKTINHPL